MSRVAIVSDSHHRDDLLEEVLQKLLDEKVEMILHLGDMNSVNSLNMLEASGLKYHAVFGNNDYAMAPVVDGYDIEKEPRVVESKNTTYKMMHLPYFLEMESDVVLYGHTHIFNIESRNGKLLLNPGEICGRESGNCEFVILESDEKKFKVERYVKSVAVDSEFVCEIFEIEREA